MSENPNVALVDEGSYSFGSTDNRRRYPNELHLDPGERASSIHGLRVDGEPALVISAAGGATGVHEHSSILIGERTYFAVGPYICRFTVDSAELDWHLRVDDATCFGVHYSEAHDALIAHGELTITRFAADGRIVWQRAGADIFSGKLSLHHDYIEAIDFEGRTYHFEYGIGE